MGVNVLVVKKPPLNSSASTTWTVAEPCIVKSCGTVMATMGVEECELTFGLSGTAIHLDFGCSAGTAMPHMASWGIVPIILPLGPHSFAEELHLSLQRVAGSRLAHDNNRQGFIFGSTRYEWQAIAVGTPVAQCAE